jgi:hypothetical protein
MYIPLWLLLLVLVYLAYAAFPWVRAVLNVSLILIVFGVLPLLGLGLIYVALTQ